MCPYHVHGGLANSTRCSNTTHHVVSQEEILGGLGAAANLEHLHEVVKLAVDVADNDNGGGHVEQVGLGKLERGEGTYGKMESEMLGRGEMRTRERALPTSLRRTSATMPRSLIAAAELMRPEQKRKRPLFSTASWRRLHQ